jgi:glycosyltransferase involved in cell wall biosynthesis
MKADSKSISIDSPLALLVKLQTPFSIRLEQEIFTNADDVVAVSNSVVQELVDYGIDQSSVTVLGNGVDTWVFTPGDRSLDAHPANILTVCRLGPRKGLVDLIACARHVVDRFPKIRFFIAGEGTYKGKIRRAIKSSNLSDNVLLLGHVPNREKLAELYRAATVFVHPAHYEGLPTVLLEAMACERPVVATSISGALDVIEDGVNGLLAPPHAPHQMAQAILRILNDPKLGRQLGTAARKTVEDSFSWRVVSQDYIAQYERVLSETSH